MPSYSPEAGYGLKALVITPGNPAIGKDAHQGGVLLSDVHTGEPLALINASAAGRHGGGGRRFGASVMAGDALISAAALQGVRVGPQYATLGRVLELPGVIDQRLQPVAASESRPASGP